MNARLMHLSPGFMHCILHTVAQETPLLRVLNFSTDYTIVLRHEIIHPQNLRVDIGVEMDLL